MKILVFGAGRMGFGAAFDLLVNSPSVEKVILADSDPAVLERTFARLNSLIGPEAKNRIERVQLDASDQNEVVRWFAEVDAVISCVNYWFNAGLARAAIIAGCNFCDLGGNNTIVDEELSLDKQALEAGINIIPDCGLAPGMVSILAVSAASEFDGLESIKIRVGGLPQDPKPPLDYQLTFAVEGLINEYIEPARIIRDGKILQVESMTEIEEVHFEGFEPLEAFQTSGGTSTLINTFAGKLHSLDYKTIRYRGHCEKFKTMIDLGLCSSNPISLDGNQIKPRKFFASLLERNLPADEPDVVLVRVEARGNRDGKTGQSRLDIVDRFDTETGLSAMMRTTAFPASIIAQQMAQGKTKRRGAVPQELAISVDEFLSELERRNIRIKRSFQTLDSN
ncbi:MAG TPA: saccharopine dehydrogenase C-terminal domain-containing protein [Pyrinomonadaceae bacterium]|nr:saccharopine dehydrogenase C-terminal domain-containing protein [Pyrinomonadaceae bacterium]